MSVKSDSHFILKSEWLCLKDIPGAGSSGIWKDLDFFFFLKDSDLLNVYGLLPLIQNFSK